MMHRVVATDAPAWGLADAPAEPGNILFTAPTRARSVAVRATFDLVQA